MARQTIRHTWDGGDEPMTAETFDLLYRTLHLLRFVRVPGDDLSGRRMNYGLTAVEDVAKSSSVSDISGVDAETWMPAEIGLKRRPLLFVTTKRDDAIRAAIGESSNDGASEESRPARDGDAHVARIS